VAEHAAMRSSSLKQKPVRGPTIIFDVVAPEAILVSPAEKYSIIKLSFALLAQLAGTLLQPVFGPITRSVKSGGLRRYQFPFAFLSPERC
jgi:hypothetical protein